MPELPDITVYTERLAALAGGSLLQRVRVLNPFLLRTAVPAIAQAEGRRLAGVERLGKRVVLALATVDSVTHPPADAAAVAKAPTPGEPLFLVLHLMIAGRLHWKPPGTRLPGGKATLAAFEFEAGTLVLTEAGTQRRASAHLVAGRAALVALDPGGIDPLACTLAEFSARLTSENHTLKRALTHPQRFSGIGNAYSDEILHRARLSPLALTRTLDAPAVARLFSATAQVLNDWTGRLRAEAARSGWPDKVTAFRPEMAVHGRFGQPCPDCGAPVQRIVHGEQETNYCARCQTGGRLLADRALSRLLKDSWPRHLDDLG